MSGAIITALVFTAALLVTTAYFILGSIPLLVLKHDTPLDARFVRGFFNTYYLCAFTTATGASISYALAGLGWISAGAAGMAVLALVLRKLVVPKMETLGAQIQSNFMDAVSGFRKLHVAAIVINIIQLSAIVWILIALSVAQMEPPSS